MSNVPPPPGGWPAPDTPGQQPTPAQAPFPAQPAPGYDAPTPGYGGAPAPQTGGGSQSNGMAVAALVCGILAFFCLGPLGGVLAVIFGFIGLGRAKETGNGKGMAVAGIVLGIVGTILSVILFFLFVVGANKAADQAAKDISGVADASSYELSPDASSCTVDSFGAINYSGTIKNKTSTEKNFTINVELRNAANDQVIDTPVDIVTNIQPGATAAWNTPAYSNNVTKVNCKVTSVENWFN